MNRGDDHIDVSAVEGTARLRVSIQIGDEPVELRQVPLAQIETIRKTGEGVAGGRVLGVPVFCALVRAARRVEFWPAADQDYQHMIEFTERPPT